MGLGEDAIWGDSNWTFIQIPYRLGEAKAWASYLVESIKSGR